MENDVLYNRIMTVVHEEYGPGNGGVLILELTQVEEGLDIGASFNDLKEAFLSGRKIITHLEFEEEGSSGDSWSNLNILELVEDEISDTPAYFINLSLCVKSADYGFANDVEDPTENIIVTSSL